MFCSPAFQVDPLGEDEDLNERSPARFCGGCEGVSEIFCCFVDARLAVFLPFRPPTPRAEKVVMLLRHTCFLWRVAVLFLFFF